MPRQNRSVMQSPDKAKSGTDRSIPFLASTLVVIGALGFVLVLTLGTGGGGVPGGAGEATVTPEQLAEALSTLTAPPPAPPTRRGAGIATPLPGGYGAQPAPTTATTQTGDAAGPGAPALAPSSAGPADSVAPTTSGAAASAPQFSITRIPSPTAAPAIQAPAAGGLAAGAPAAVTPEATAGSGP